MFRIASLAVLIALLAVEAHCQDILITEFQALNKTTLADRDGQHPDWFELLNAEGVPVNLSGWFATDDPQDLTKWRFPSVTLAPGEYLLVFASNKDLRDPAGELHTNFKLRSEGEYLALVAPDGKTVVWDYGPDYPPQPADFSYGLGMGGDSIRLVEPGAPARTLVPTSDAVDSFWTDPDFDDSGWIAGVTGIGYDARDDDFLPLIATNVQDQMYGISASAYIRIPFYLDDPAAIGVLALRMKYDDGFVAYINGVRVARANDPSPPAWDSHAIAVQIDAEALDYELFEVPSSPGLLRQGWNVLAIHGLNVFDGSVDFLIVPELEGFEISTDIDRETFRYFEQPTPGFGNLYGYVELAERPRIEPEGGVFRGNITVKMEIDSPGTDIRYTMDGSIPGEGSPRYTAPLSFDRSILIRARGFRAGIRPSPAISAGYIRLANDVRSFNSDLPIVLMENFGDGRPPTEPKRPAYLAIFEPKEDGRSSVAELPDLTSRVGVEVRGSTTSGDPKPSMMFEAWDEDDDDKEITPLGMPEDSDWVLYGAYYYDRALMRNHFIYHLSNEVGRYAVRSRFCEVFFNWNGGSLSKGDYLGVYSFMEKVSRGEKRVDVEPLPGDALTEPEITGGYILKVDRADPGDAGFNTQRQDNLLYFYPKERNIAPAQAVWIKGYLQRFEDALFGPNFRSPVYGYPPYVDVDSWIDHHILNALPMNVDAFRLSTYFFKTRGGKIEYGPIWDFDRSMGSADGRDDNPCAWNGTGDSSKYFDFDARYPWWHQLFQDPDFYQRWKDRWYLFRQDQLSTEHMHAMIDGFKAELEESSVRNFEEWSNLISPSKWPQQVEVLKDWLAERASWIDSQFPVPPQFSSPGGRIAPGFKLSITAPQGTIYCTLDGSDPRAPGGDVAAGASRYTGPLTIDGNARVVARARVSASNWSAPAADTYVVTPTPLVVTEIMYHPPDGPLGSPFEDNDYEFIEIFNRSDRALSLTGVRFVAGIRFSFVEGTLLFPRRYAVLVRNLYAFESRYPNWRTIAIVGEYEGALENRGEQILVLGPLEERILDFAYSDTWYPSTDGEGYSLSVADPDDPRDLWGERRSWLASDRLLGTPGRDNSAGPGGLQLPGDINQDGNLDIGDPVGMLQSLFGALSGLFPCEGNSLTEGGNLVLLDINGDGTVNLADAIWELAFLFAQGPPPVGGTGCIPIDGCPDACSP